MSTPQSKKRGFTEKKSKTPENNTTIKKRTNEQSPSANNKRPEKKVKSESLNGSTNVTPVSSPTDTGKKSKKFNKTNGTNEINETIENEQSNGTPQKSETTPTKGKKEGYVEILPSAYQPGQIVSVTVQEFLPASNQLRVKLPNKEAGFLPITQLSDFLPHCERMAKRLKNKGTVLKEVLVINEHYGLHLTMKQSMIDASRQKKSAFTLSEVKINTVYPAYINGKKDYGYFVNLCGGLTALYPEKSGSVHYEVGQSVNVHVDIVDTISNRIKVNLKPTLCASENPLALLNQYFKEEEEMINGSKFQSVDWTKFKLGDLLNLEITSIKEFGVLLSSTLLPNVSIIANNNVISHKHKLKEGDKVKGRVVDVQYDNGVIEVSLRNEFVNSKIDNKSKIPIGKDLEVFVEYIKEHIIVVSFNNGSNVAYALSKDLNEYQDSNSLYTIGSKITVTFKSIRGSGPHSRVLCLAKREIKEDPKIENGTPASDKNNFRNNITDINSIKIGMPVKVRVHAVKRFELLVGLLGSPIHGRIHITELQDFEDENTPLIQYKKGDIITAKVLDIVDMEFTQSILAVSNAEKKTKKSIVWLSAKKSRLDLPGNEIGTPLYQFDNLKVGQIVDGIIHKVGADEMQVFLSRFAEGRVFVLDVSNDIDELAFMAEKFQPGKPIRCRVIGINGKRLDLSLKAVNDKFFVPNSKPAPGTITIGRIVRIDRESLLVQIGTHQVATVYYTDLDDIYLRKPSEKYEVNQYVKCFVLAIKGGMPILSLRPSRLTSGVVIDIKDKYYQKEIKSPDDMKPNDLVHGFIHQVHLEQLKFLLIRVSHNLYVKVFPRDIDDVFIEESDISRKFYIGKRVTMRIKSIDDQGHFIGTMKPSEIYQNVLTIDQFKQGKVVSGKVTNVLPTGITVIVYGSTVKGFCSTNNVSDANIENPAELYKTGDKVKALVTKISKDNNKIPLKLVMKESAVNKAIASGHELKTNIEMEDEDDDIQDIQLDYDNNNNNNNDNNEEQEEQEKPKKSKRKQMEEQKEESNENEEQEEEQMKQDEQEEQEEQEEEEVEEKPVKQVQKVPAKKSKKEPEPPVEESDDDDEENMEVEVSEKSVPALNVNVGFEWDDVKPKKMEISKKVQEDEEDAEEDIEEEDMAADRKKLKIEKKKEKKQKAEDIEQKEIERMEQKAPQAPQEFERTLLSSPNSSYLWMKYMAHYVSMTEIDKARQLAQRALKTIDSNEEKEKLNVWIAWLNLENSYGSQESLLEVFNKSIQYNDQKTMHLKLAEIYERSDNIENADKLYKTICKKFKESKKIWKKYALFLVTHEKVAQFRAMIPEALKSLPKRKHVEMISKFGQIEFKYGNVERGRTIFEGIISNYPKKVDQWSVYLDMEIRNGDRDIIRRLFERVVSLKFSSKKMKFFFKRFLGWEKHNGTEENIARVKELAQEFVENSMK